MKEHDLVPSPRGLRLRVCTWGPDAGRPVLVLHGFLEQGAAWDTFARALGGRVVAPDHRGHGLSAHVGAGGSYAFWDYVADVDGVVRALGGEVDLVGHSMGGTIAALFAATRPAAVRRLVLVEGLGLRDLSHEVHDRAEAFLDAMAAPPRHKLFPDVAAAAARMTRVNPNLGEAQALRLAARVTRPTVPGDTEAEAHREGWLTWTWDPLHKARNPVPFRADVHRGFLARIQAPTLVIDGGDSPLAPDDALARVAAIPTSRRVVLPGAGHLVHHDAPEALADLVRAHLET